MKKFEAVIGLEVHAELLTNSKIFCACSAHFGGEINAHVCPICLGMPGVLPVLNKQVLEFALRAALATNCQVTTHSKFDRKNYFYPDLPKGYQISQYDQPIATQGWLDIESGGQTTRIGITRIHMEEDAGKLVHAGADRMAGSVYSLVDLNRAGVPLLEIVSEPDIRSSDEARAYVAELRGILREIGVCDGKMEEGSLRCDANVSVRPVGQEALGTRVEIKNINSLRFLQRAVDYEINRHIACLQAEESLVQETRLWDENKNMTISMRSKEDEHDYRYFPDPDLVMLSISPDFIESIRLSLPELPAQKRKRYENNWHLSSDDARTLTEDHDMAIFFEETRQHGKDPQSVVNWLLGDISAYLNEKKQTLSQTCLTPAKLAEMLTLIENKTISGKIAKNVLQTMLEKDQTSAQIVANLGLTQISDPEQLSAMINTVLENNPNQVQQYFEGKQKVMGYFIGQIMKVSKGRADPTLTNQLLQTCLARLKSVP